MAMTLRNGLLVTGGLFALMGCKETVEGKYLDTEGIALVAETPYLVVVNPQSGVRTLKDFIALAKQKPGTLNYASAGLGTSTHLAGALFATLAGIELVHVPYKTTPDLVTDLLSNRVQATFVPPALVNSPAT